MGVVAHSLIIPMHGSRTFILGEKLDGSLFPGGGGGGGELYFMGKAWGEVHQFVEEASAPPPLDMHFTLHAVCASLTTHYGMAP